MEDGGWNSPVAMARNLTMLLLLLFIISLFFLKNGVDTCPFVGPLIPLFWTSGDVPSGFQSQSHYYSLIWALLGQTNNLGFLFE